MKKRNASVVILLCGVMLFCLTCFSIYQDFFAPKLGPLGTGERHWTVYAMYTSGILGSVIYSIWGGYLLWKNNTEK